jgi:hypothetical protein
MVIIRPPAICPPQSEAEQRGQVNDELIPDDVSLQELAEQVVRGKVKLSPAQQRMLIELLPFYMAEAQFGGGWFLKCK